MNPGPIPAAMALRSTASVAATLLARLDAIPRARLAVARPPLHAVVRLTARIGGPDLWFVRDDLLGFGGGGNKVRGLEYLLAAAEEAGADTLITGAGPQSNHVRATAATAAVAGMAMHAVCWGDQPPVDSGNLLLTRRFGASVHFTGDADRTSVDRGMETVASEVRAAGRRPYLIPRGGAAPLGVLGHVRAAMELAEMHEGSDRAPALVVLAVGSGGTIAGWLLATRLLGLGWDVVGYTVSRPVAEVQGRVIALAAEAAAILGFTPDEASVASFVDIRDGVIGRGYGIPTPEGAEAITLVARTEGVLLDPTYTGKALAGYIADVAAGRFRGIRRAVFIHSGGEPANFAVHDD